MSQWLKITFDPCMPGTASVSQFPRKRRLTVPGQWVVFDKNLGIGGLKEYTPRARLFASGDVNECHAYMDRNRDA